MSFDLNQNSWRAFQGGMSMQMASLTSVKGPLDPDDAVKSARKSHPVRCAIDSASLARLSESMAHLTGCDFRADLTAPVGSHRPKLLVKRTAYLASGATQERSP